MSIICKIFGHKYYISKFITPEVKVIGCKRCGKRFGMNNRHGGVIEIKGDIERLSEVLRRRGK